MPTAVVGVKFSPQFVCVSICFFRTISQKSMQLGSPNLTHKRSTMSPGNPFILGSKGQTLKVKRSRVTNTLPALYSCECWLLLDIIFIYTMITVTVRSALVHYNFAIITSPSSVSGRTYYNQRVCLSLCLSAIAANPRDALHCVTPIVLSKTWTLSSVT